MELKLKTDVGELTAIFVSDHMNDKTVYTAWIEEYPSVVTQADSIQEAMDNLPKILDMWIEVEIAHLMEKI